MNLNDNIKSKSMLSNTQIMGIGAAGTSIVLLWNKIVEFFNFFISIFIETITFNDYQLLCIDEFLIKNSQFHYKWKHCTRSYNLFLKKYKTRRRCFFVYKQNGLYFNIKWGGIVVLIPDCVYYFRFSKFIKNYSNEIFKDIYRMEYEKEYNNFFIKNISGQPHRMNNDNSNETMPQLSEEILDDRSIIKRIKLGLLEPIYFNIDDFGIEDKKEMIFKDYYLNESMKSLLNEAEKWIQHENWFKERNITWKRGYCLYGEPGCGKSSFVLRLAKYLGIPLYVYNLSTLTNSEIVENWNNMSKPCLVLFEDFDSVFEARKNVSDVGQMQNKLTFDTILNIIDGVNSCDGTLTILTTNCLNKLDAAILRSGRIDSKIKVTALNKTGKEFIAKKILNGNTELYDELLKTTNETESNADFENRCIQLALKHFWKE